MRGENQDAVCCKKIIWYCEEIARILGNHHFDRGDFEYNTEFQFAVGMCVIQIGELVARLDEDFIAGNTAYTYYKRKRFTFGQNCDKIIASGASGKTRKLVYTFALFI